MPSQNLICYEAKNVFLLCTHERFLFFYCGTVRKSSGAGHYKCDVAFNSKIRCKMRRSSGCLDFAFIAHALTAIGCEKSAARPREFVFYEMNGSCSMELLTHFPPNVKKLTACGALSKGDYIFLGTPD